MAKEKFERTKPHVNIGTIGHVDHGKTCLLYTSVSALDEIAWTLNIRGNDVHCNPVVVSYLIINEDVYKRQEYG